MKFKTFSFFVAPSIFVMVLLIALPLFGVLYLSLFNSYTKTEVVEIKTSVPLFGGLKQETTQKISQPVLDKEGNPIQVWEYVKTKNINSILGVQDIKETLKLNQSKSVNFIEKTKIFIKSLLDISFWRALEFTLLYVLVTTPFVLLIGFLLALAVHSTTQYLKGPLIFTSLLPFIITPVVGSLSIYWLFLDNAVISSVLQSIGVGKVYFLKDAFSIRSLIITYGIWHVSPFAFVVLYAGLQTLPQDSLESAIVDGASRVQRVFYIVLPHLKPLFIFITLIHVMDAYRIFEPVLVFGSNLYANSLQYLTYDLLNAKDNFHKAAASSLLNVLGIMLLLIPILIHTFKNKSND